MKPLAVDHGALKYGNHENSINGGFYSDKRNKYGSRKRADKGSS